MQQKSIVKLFDFLRLWLKLRFLLQDFLLKNKAMIISREDLLINCFLFDFFYNCEEIQQIFV